jgi:hypothetical protein
MNSSTNPFLHPLKSKIIPTTHSKCAPSAYFYTMKPKLILLFTFLLGFYWQFTQAQQAFTHHVLIWLKNPDSEADMKKLLEGVDLLKRIPEVQKVIVSRPAPTEKRPVVDNSFSLSCLFYFKDIKAHDAYQIHPLHKEFVAKYSTLWQKVLVYDAEEIAD